MFIVTLGDLIEYGFLALLILGFVVLVLAVKISNRRAKKKTGSLGK